ncbi:MAG: bacillithiol biosynthesis protein BshC, partial [Thermoanaerobaculia bacterium]
MSDPACLRIPLADYPGLNGFVRDWAVGDTKAARFLPRDRTGLEPRGAGRPIDPALVTALDASNRRWGLFVKDQLERWASGQSVTLVAGQQVGFAGGPLYTLAKVATLVRMKRDLEAAGKPATVFFWLATEDHDFDEVARLSVPMSTIRPGAENGQLDLLTIKATRSVESRAAVGDLPVPEALITELLALYELARPPWLREGVTFRDSFAELMASVFGAEVILVDSLLPELRRAGAPLFKQISERWTDIQAALKRRAADLASAGYSPQVAPRDDGEYTLLFEIDDRGDRHIVTRPRAIEPERTSTSAITRPLLQDAVLRPDVFIGGPAEVAYYAQIAPLHSLLNVRMPRVGLRGHVLVGSRRVLKSVDRLQLSPKEMFDDPGDLLARREPEGVDSVRRLAEEGNRELVQRIEQIGEIALPAEHSLARAFSRSVGHIEYHFNKLAERAIKGLVRKDRERWAAARELAATLHPDGRVQDRVVAWFPWWLRHEK